MARVHVLAWNGSDLPAELRRLPAGQYMIEEVESAPKLTAAQDEGLRLALESVRAGRTSPAAEAFARLDKIIESAARQGAAKRATKRRRTRSR
jgi:hypothetical protein